MAFNLKKCILAQIFILRAFYSISIHLFGLVLKVLSPFNKKIKLGVYGRKETFDRLKQHISKTDKTLWMHCASLGEYEQGLPVLQALKKHYPEHKIVVSFFSPSGYEHKKNAPEIDVAVYLPLDTKQNAKRFLDATHPELIVFVKYDIWTHLLLEAKQRQLKAILISATIRPNQLYFKWYGALLKKALFSFDHIFTQDETSKNIIERHGYTSVSVSGDTRFDRVRQQLSTDNSVGFIEEFIDGKTTVVFGSSWPADDALFIPFINTHMSKDIKFIIAPHATKESYTERLKRQLNGKTVAFSDMKEKYLSDYNIFILDTIGFLTRVYSYADIAYVGGAAGQTGLHNILEPAVFGIPIIIGKQYSKFPEASALISLGGASSVKDTHELNSLLSNLLENPKLRKEKGEICARFIEEGQGAIEQIIDYIRR